MPLHEVVDATDIEVIVPLSIEKSEAGYVVRGTRAENLISRTNIDNPEAVQRLQVALNKIGVFQALGVSGIQEGEQVTIGNVSFSFYDEMPE